LTELQKDLKERQRTVDSINVSEADLRRDFEQKKLVLEAKSNKTGEEMMELQSLIFILNGSDEANELLAASAEEAVEAAKWSAKYDGIDTMLKASFGKILIESAKGLSG